MNNLSREQILASSSGWVASLLNFLPGLGTGYLYQRRWMPYFFTLGAEITWFLIGLIYQAPKETTQKEQLIGVSGLFIISIITVVEANIAFKKAVEIATLKEEQKKSLTKKRWFSKK